MLLALRGKGTGPAARNQLAPGKFVPVAIFHFGKLLRRGPPLPSCSDPLGAAERSQPELGRPLFNIRRDVKFLDRLPSEILDSSKIYIFLLHCDFVVRELYCVTVGKPMAWGDHYLSRAAELLAEAEREKDLQVRAELESRAWAHLRMANQAKGNDPAARPSNGVPVIKREER
jgi:hypothetical protein